MSTAAEYFLLKQPRDTSHESERKVSASEQENPRAVQGYLTLGISTIVFQEKPVWIAYHHLVTAAVAYKDLPWEGPNIDANQYENEEPQGCQTKSAVYHFSITRLRALRIPSDNRRRSE